MEDEDTFSSAVGRIVHELLRDAFVGLAGDLRRQGDAEILERLDQTEDTMLARLALLYAAGSNRALEENLLLAVSEQVQGIIRDARTRERRHAFN
ncbi:hypothetical protein J2X36_005052 [Methylobacterium sp. BE186]|uniref:hypothetical protein n=1 Tax=Methylobacterium sp. BE186 TaxID=2817715 RepID=UPI0028657037|nr:hypothetical protein [Methylobacterium sp. BE186]MDR7040270.1 hypothetical protein [Methylobacterium sp. BE186]